MNYLEIEKVIGRQIIDSTAHWKAASAYNEYCERGVAFSPSSALLQSMRNIYRQMYKCQCCCDTCCILRKWYSCCVSFKSIKI